MNLIDKSNTQKRIVANFSKKLKRPVKNETKQHEDKNQE